MKVSAIGDDVTINFTFADGCESQFTGHPLTFKYWLPTLELSHREWHRDHQPRRRWWRR